ncbi:NDR1/HIN1-like protein 2 [Juglans microcarpa x Juglans regia]|uniref:NDR1/HIN1-like protein 2 n=1 Tax=Juglans microcarpa x Juglans regia TaxID=2249226 RepID=UPI001B7EB5CB|nr:NDR1/HIN1-like protein 2 [Juglans microcarpa x Juglans regia]
MHNSGQLPVQSNRDSRPIKRHHTAREIVHRVRDSLTTRVSKLVCAIFLAFLLFLGLITFVLWLSLRPHRPRFHIHEFSVPEATNARVSFNVTIRNPNLSIGIYYDSMNGTVYYKDQKFAWKQLLFPFYQKPKNTTVVVDELSGSALTVNDQRWTELKKEIRAAGMVPLRLEITSNIRFKISTWQSKRHQAHANCDVSLGTDGILLPTYIDKRCPVYFT